MVRLVAKNIKRLMEFKNLSQKKICAAVGVPQGRSSSIEYKKVEPSISKLEKLALVFEVSISEFFKTIILTKG